MPAKSNLNLHCGAKAVARERVDAAATPARTPTWVPVPHRILLDGVLATLARAGLRVVGEAHALAKAGGRYFGLLQVAGGEPDGDSGLVVGLRNSHDQSFPAGIVVGASVFVCDNLSFSGEVRLARKHTARIERDLPQLVERAVGRLGDLRRAQDVRFAAYRGRELSEAAAHDLVVRALDAGVLPVTRVPAVLREWREPRHREFRDGRTAWRLFNAFTEALKGNLDSLPRRTQALHGLLDGACGLLATAA
ncbi:MAG: DUF932 domain-containing protein [Gemmataceae bacterium]